MAARASKQKAMTQPVHTRISIMLYEQKNTKIEGIIIGFDEYMNLVLDEAEEIAVKKNERKPLGRILLKGDNITLIANAK